ncbi:MAG TPA: alpha/beta hydrolase domain-containing protein [Vicinamibacterales bacterium]|nr:alpha/beta hydrolase domain-containing protein [Vicinamibacterales bacterium]
MKSMYKAGLTVGAVVIVAALFTTESLFGQGGGQAPAAGRAGGQGRGGQGPGGPGGPGGGRGAVQQNLPASPTAVTLPTMTEVTGPGPMYDSAPSQPAGKGLDFYKYQAKEYFISGTANGQPYKTRMVVRMPADRSRFSGLVLVESMHGSGAAHMFEYTSMYTMASGHAAVEIVTTPNTPGELTKMNEARYKEMALVAGQNTDILAQAGALIKSGSPLGGAVPRKMVLAGTSQTAGILINYLPGHVVYRTPKMERIYDGFMPTSNGSNITQDVDVPIVHVPTMHEVSGQTITWRQDSDEAGKQYRLYEFSGMAHVDTRDAARMMPNPCAQPLSTYPLQAYMSVALNHLFNWVDKGVAPPRADRIWLDRNEADGSTMALDDAGNPRGGIRSPYVDVPVVKYRIRPPVANPFPANPSAWMKANGNEKGGALMCNLSASQLALSKDELKKRYKNKKNYAGMVERRVNELEKAGWSLPVYRELILSDAAKVDF